MNKFFVSAALVAAMAAPLAAQSSVVTGEPSVFTLTPYAGYMIFGDHFKTGNNVEFSNEDGALYGVQLGVDMTRNVSLVGNFAYSKTAYSFENLGGPGQDIRGANVGIWLYDANLHFKVPFLTGNAVVAPFAQAGVGALKFTPDRDDFNSDGTTNVAFNVGLGADWQVGGLGLRVMVKDYISSFKWEDFQSANDPGDLENADPSHNWALSLGLRIGF